VLALQHKGHLQKKHKIITTQITQIQANNTKDNQRSLNLRLKLKHKLAK